MSTSIPPPSKEKTISLVPHLFEMQESISILSPPIQQFGELPTLSKYLPLSSVTKLLLSPVLMFLKMTSAFGAGYRYIVRDLNN